MTAARLLQIRRHPVKAMAGESLDSVAVDPRGIVGDRGFAVVDAEGRLASGKNSTRMRRYDPVFDYAARTTADGVRVSGRDGDWAVGDPDLDRHLSAAFEAPVRVLPESDVSYFDDCPISLVGTATLAWLRADLGSDGDVRRFRTNLLVETAEPFEEESWTEMCVGDVELRFVKRTERCRMVDIAQNGVPAERGVLKHLAATREVCLGIFADVVSPGTLRTQAPVSSRSS